MHPGGASPSSSQDGPRRLPLITTVLYSVGNAGVNMAYGFANLGLPLFLATYGVPNTVIGFLAQERCFVGGFVQPVVGAISDRVRGHPLGRRRPFFLVGVPLTAAALALLAAYPPFWAVVVLVTVFSFFLAVVHDPYLALLPDLTTEVERGRVGGVMAAFNMLGQLSVIVLAFLLWEVNERLVFWLVAAGLVGTFAVTFFAVREPPAPAEPPRALRGYKPMSYLRDVLRYRELCMYIAASGFFWLGTGGIVPFLTRFGVETLGVAESISFVLVLPAVLGTAIFAIPAGVLAERTGKKPVLAAGLVLYSAAALVGAQLVQSVADALVVMSVVGLANAVVTALMFPLLADLMPRTRTGEFTGLGALVWSLAQPVGAVLAGAMADVTGTLRGAFAAGGLCIVVGCLLLLAVRPERARDEAENTLAG